MVFGTSWLQTFCEVVLACSLWEAVFFFNEYCKLFQQQATFKNTIILLVCSSKIPVSLGTTVSPKRKWKQCLCKILESQTKSIVVFLKLVYAHKLVMYSRRTEFHLSYKKSVIFLTVGIIISVNDVRLWKKKLICFIELRCLFFVFFVRHINYVEQSGGR